MPNMRKQNPTLAPVSVTMAILAVLVAVVSLSDIAPTPKKSCCRRGHRISGPTIRRKTSAPQRRDLYRSDFCSANDRRGALWRNARQVLRRGSHATRMIRKKSKIRLARWKQRLRPREIEQIAIDLAEVFLEVGTGDYFNHSAIRDASSSGCLELCWGNRNCSRGTGISGALNARPSSDHGPFSVASTAAHLPAPAFTTINGPIASTSMRVRLKQSIASSGVQTIGSFSLKLVFRITGIPVLR